MPDRAPAIGPIACIEIVGPDARRFAQAQFAGDVEALAADAWQWNAWLSAQGRVRAVMQLAAAGDGNLLAILRAGEAESLCTDLARYRMRDRVTLQARTFTGHVAGPLPGCTVSRETSGTVLLGYGDRSLGLAVTSAPADAAASLAWRLRAIRQGWPTLPADAADFLPPALGLERLGAVSFSKGCYPGQEIATRLHHRRNHKWRLGHLSGPHSLVPGAAQIDSGSNVWVLDSIATSEGAESLAVVPITSSNDINILGEIHHVVSIFDV